MSFQEDETDKSWQIIGSHRQLTLSPRILLQVTEQIVMSFTAVDNTRYFTDGKIEDWGSVSPTSHCQCE